MYRFAPEAEGHGTDAMVKAFHRLGGKIRARVPFVKSIASILTIGTGGSAGREGPIAQIGAGFGAFLADRVGLSERERRLLMLAGGAGGIGAIFRCASGRSVICERSALQLDSFRVCRRHPVVHRLDYGLHGIRRHFRPGTGIQHATPYDICAGFRAPVLSRICRCLCVGRIRLRPGVLWLA